MSTLCYSTASYGSKYYNATNKLIESLNIIENKKLPTIFVMTDKVDAINKHPNVFVKDINDYNPKYSTYNDNYYRYNATAHRYNVLHALENGYTNITYIDTDLLFLPNFDLDIVETFFEPNTVAGESMYGFKDYFIGAMLGKRFASYYKHFEGNENLDQFKDMVMPDDRLIYFSFRDINHGKEYVEWWGKCSDYREQADLCCAPVGNLDENCFCAYKTGMKVEPSHAAYKYKMTVNDHVTH